MKYWIFLAFFLIGLAPTTQAQSNDAISKYFSQYVDDENFTVVYVSPKMFEILGKLELDHLADEDAQIALEMVRKLKSIRVLTTEVDPMTHFNKAANSINLKEYETLVTVREKDENVKLMIRNFEGSVIDEMLVIVGGDDEFILVSIEGEIDLQNIAMLSKTMDIKGIEYLDKVEEKQD